jgi:mitochondrial fission protein ELM1
MPHDDEDWHVPLCSKCCVAFLAQGENEDHLMQATVWLLIDDRPGHATQVRGVARRLGLPAVEKALHFNALNRLPNPLLGASDLSLRKDRSDKIDPPYPGLVIGMGRRIVPVARAIKRASGGRTRIVLLGRKAANDSDAADLSVACAHFHLLPHPDLVELVVPPTQVDVDTLTAAREVRPDPMLELKHPRVVLLAGGPTAQHAFGADFAGRMARDIAAATSAIDGGLAIVTSRRTPKDAIAAMRSAAPQAHVHEWRAGRADNPFLSYLAHGDLLVVTGESESLLAEAAATGLPVTIYPLPARPKRLKDRFAEALRARAEKSALARMLIDGGWVAPPRDLGMMHQMMAAHGRAQLFDGSLNQTKPAPADELDDLARRIKALIVSP